MKKIAAILLSGVFAVTLMAGCGNGTARNVGEDAAQKVQETGEEITQKIQETGGEMTQKGQENVDTSKFIGEEKAKNIALEKAGVKAEGVVFEKVELDRDDGIWQYEVEFKKDRTEYDADIKADDGTILSWDVDND